MDEVILVITNLPDRDSARQVADELIESRAAACVNILAECTSVYRWQGKIESANEIPLLIKTTQNAYPRVEAIIRKLHPYELPEIIAVTINAGLPDYLKWARHEIQGPEIQGPEIQDQKSKTRNPRPEIQDQKSKPQQLKNESINENHT